MVIHARQNNFIKQVGLYCSSIYYILFEIAWKTHNLWCWVRFKETFVFTLYGTWIILRLNWLFPKLNATMNYCKLVIIISKLFGNIWPKFSFLECKAYLQLIFKKVSIPESYSVLYHMSFKKKQRPQYNKPYFVLWLLVILQFYFCNCSSTWNFIYISCLGSRYSWKNCDSQKFLNKTITQYKLWIIYPHLWAQYSTLYTKIGKIQLNLNTHLVSFF